MNEPPRRIASLAELPQEMPPTHDLWPGIAARIAPQPVRRPVRAWRPVAAVAATLAILAVGIWIGRSAAPVQMAAAPVQIAAAPMQKAAAPEEAAVAPVLAPDARGPTATLLAAFTPDARYQHARQQLLDQSRARVAALPPEAQTRVAASLAMLQRSIAELRAALGRDPANVLLQELLLNAYQDEMRVLVTVDAAGSAGKEI
jgi:hypothetical protein